MISPATDFQPHEVYINSALAIEEDSHFSWAAYRALAYFVMQSRVWTSFFWINYIFECSSPAECLLVVQMLLTSKMELRHRLA